MVVIITENSDVLNHELYFDNFFSDYELMCELAEKDVRATGTIREIEQEEQSKNLLDPKISKRWNEAILIIALTVKFLWLNVMTIP